MYSQKEESTERLVGFTKDACGQCRDGWFSVESAGDGGFPAPANGMERIPLGCGGPAIVFGRLVASGPNLAVASVEGFDGVLTVSSSSELSSSPEIGALADNGELRVGRVEGCPIPRPVGVLVGLGDTIGIEDDDSLWETRKLKRGRILVLMVKPSLEACRR